MNILARNCQDYASNETKIGIKVIRANGRKTNGDKLIRHKLNNKQHIYYFFFLKDIGGKVYRDSIRKGK